MQKNGLAHYKINKIWAYPMLFLRMARGRSTNSDEAQWEKLQSLAQLAGNLIHRDLCSQTVNVNAECEPLNGWTAWDATLLVFESPVRSGYLVPRGSNRDRDRLAFVPKPKIT